MIPLLTYPLALFALTTLPALAAIYILRNRFRRRTVSSLLLWRFQVQSKAGGAKFHRLQLPLLFLLELLALALLVAAAAGPQWKLPQSARPLIVILDDSFSMRAISGGVSARTRAESFLQHLLSAQPPPSTRFILAGARARSLEASAGISPPINDLLQQWHCWSADTAIDAAITLAAELGRNQANILILTDHKPPAENFSSNRIEWRAFGEAVDNFAIVNASRTTFGDQDRCLLEVANFSGRAGEEARSVRLTVQAGTDTPQNSILSIGPGERQRVVFNLPASAPVLRAALDAAAGSDGLDVDNQVQLLPPIRKRVRVQLALADENLRTLANRTLDATGLRAAISSDPQILIHDGATAATNPADGDCWNLHWIGSGGANAFVSPFIIDTSHPLGRGVALQGAVWAGATAANTSGDVPVILAGNTPLLSVREDAPGRRLLTLNFNPELSTLQDTPDWPVLFWNLLQWRSAEMRGLNDSNVRLGAEANLKTAGQGVNITQPDGTTRSFPKTGGELALETPMPGIYSVMMGAARSQFSVNPLSADESDLSSCVSGHWGAWGETTEVRLEETSAVWIFGLLALVMLSAHLFLLAGGKGGR